MVTELFFREVATSSIFRKTGYKRLLSLLTTAIYVGIFIFLEVFLYGRLYDQLNIYTSFNESFLTILVFAFMLLGVIFLVPTIYSSFFKNKDEQVILGNRPIRQTEIFVSKSLFCYFKALFFSFATLFPICIVYGVKSNAPFLFYLGLFFSIFLVTVIELGVALLLSIPFREVFFRLKRQVLILLVVTLAITFGLAYLYSNLLDVFVSLVRSASLDSLFTASRIETMTAVSQKLYPAIFMTRFININDSLLQLLLLFTSIGISLVVSIPLFLLYYNYYLKESSSSQRPKNYFNPPIRITDPTKALIKKELSLVFSNSDGVFSYFSLIAVQPFLVYLVISAINLIFTTGNLNYMQSTYPTFTLALNAALILLFLAVINSTSSLSLSKEKDTIDLMKTLPLSPAKQLFIKLMVPYTLSSISYLVTMLVIGCLLTRTDGSFTANNVPFTWTSVILLMIIGLLALLALNLSSLYSDLKMKENGDFISVLIDFILPIIFVLASSLLTLLVDDAYKDITFYCIILGLEIILLIPLAIRFKSRVNKLFILYNGGKRA